MSTDLERPRGRFERLGRGDLPALVAAFGFGTIGIVGAAAVGWILGAIVAAIFLGRSWGTWLGLVLAVVAYNQIMDSIAQVPPGEWTSLDRTLRWYWLPIAGLLGAIIVFLGRHDRPDPTSFDIRLGVALTSMGAVVALLTGLTWANLLVGPSQSSFEVSLPAGWTVLDRRFIPWDWEPAHGNQFTAVYYSGASPMRTYWPSTAAVAGVSVHQSRGDASDCYRSGRAWAAPSTLYEWKLVTSGPRTLAAGAAYEVVRVNDAGDTRIFAAGLRRDRWLGLVVENLCYIVAVTVPDGSGLTEADANGILESFRFR